MYSKERERERDKYIVKQIKKTDNLCTHFY